MRAFLPLSAAAALHFPVSCEVDINGLVFDARTRATPLSFYNTSTGTTYFLSLCAPLKESDIPSHRRGVIMWGR